MRLNREWPYDGPYWAHVKFQRLEWVRASERANQRSFSHAAPKTVRCSETVAAAAQEAKRFLMRFWCENWNEIFLLHFSFRKVIIISASLQLLHSCNTLLRVTCVVDCTTTKNEKKRTNSKSKASKKSDQKQRRYWTFCRTDIYVDFNRHRYAAIHEFRMVLFGLDRLLSVVVLVKFYRFVFFLPSGHLPSTKRRSMRLLREFRAKS